MATWQNFRGRLGRAQQEHIHLTISLISFNGHQTHILVSSCYPLPLCSMSFPERASSRTVPKQSTLNGFGKGRTLVRQVRFKPLRLTLSLPSSKRPFSQPLTLSLPRMINFKFPLQPYEKYYITQYEELGYS